MKNKYIVLVLLMVLSIAGFAMRQAEGSAFFQEEQMYFNSGHSVIQFYTASTLSIQDGMIPFEKELMKMGSSLITLFLFLSFLSEDYSIPLDLYKIFQPSLLAVSDQDNVCLAAPLTHELLFFDKDGKLVCRYRRDSDAPDGFRQIVHVGYHAQSERFYLYDFGRKISFWSEKGQFEESIFLKTLLWKPRLLTSQDVLYVTQDDGSINSTPTLTLLKLNNPAPETLLTYPALADINGYLRKYSDGLPVKTEWHHQLLLAVGRNFFVSSYNRRKQFSIFDAGTLKLRKNVEVLLPSVPVEAGDFKECLENAAKMESTTTNALLVPASDVYYPVPYELHMDSGDRIFVYSQNFQGYIRLQYNVEGVLTEKRSVYSIPKYINTSFHYFLDFEHRNTITREAP